jgi:hypothetical protein
MQDVTNPLAGSRVKIERAKKHVQDLIIALTTFSDSKPYKVGTKRDSETKRLIYYVTEVRELPPHIATIVGDVIHNLRSALDYLAYQLVIVGKGNNRPFRHVEFPIFDSAQKYEAGKHRKIKGMRPEAIKAIDIIKPYKSGNDQLWRLHRLNNIDKHRLLITVSSYFQSIGIGTILNREMKEAFPDIGEIPIPSVSINPADKKCPLKADDELFTDLPDAEFNDKIPFRFEVSLNEPEVIECEPILVTLQQFIDMVGKIIESFDSHIFWTP